MRTSCLPGGKFWRGACGVVLVMVGGCTGASVSYVAPEGPMPANTVLLSQMMRELSAAPGFTDALLERLNEEGKKGPALMTPSLMKRLRELILGKNWQGLNRFPGWTLQGLNPTVKVAGKIVTKKENEGAGHPAAAEVNAPVQGAAVSTAQIENYIDLGPYTLEKAETVNLNVPSTLPGFTTEGLVSELGTGVTRGDGPNAELAPMHAESQRMADVLNRMSLNGLDGAELVTAEIGGHKAASPEEMARALMATGHTVVVSDERYFANFGHFHFKGQEVMMPFWIDSQIAIPGTKRPLLVPVSHAEYEWEIRGPKVNANVSWYFGIDGKSQFRTMDTQDQAWVLGRRAHEYRGDDAVEVTRLVGRMVVAFMRQHLRRSDLPFGGYYPLGVCQDGVAAIEKKMTGRATLFPNTADETLFDDPRDAEVNAMMLAIPKDRAGALPEPERIFGSLPTTDLHAITIPGLAEDLSVVKVAWEEGSLERTPSWIRKMATRVIGAAALLLLVGIVLWRRQRRKQ